MRASLRAWRVSMIALVPLLTGCFKLSRETPPIRYFVLSGAARSGGDAPATSDAPPASSSAAPADASPAPNGNGLTLGLRRLDLAAYLAVPSIVMRRGANEIVVNEFQRWGEDPSDGINRAFAARLAAVPPVRSVDVAPWAMRARHDFLMQLHVSRFEGVADSSAREGRSQLHATWDIIRPLDGRILIRGETAALSAPWRVGDYAALVNGLDAALASMAQEIAACLARFPNDSTPPPSCATPWGQSHRESTS